MDRVSRIAVGILVVFLLLFSFLYRRDALHAKDQIDRNTERLDEIESEGSILAESLDAVIAQVRLLCQNTPGLDPTSTECQPVSPPSKDIAENITEGDGSVILRVPGEEHDDPEVQDPEVQDPEVQDPEIDDPEPSKGSGIVEGVGIVNIELNGECELIVTFSNGATTNLGEVCGEDGATGPAGPPGSPGSDTFTCPPGSTLATFTVVIQGGPRDAFICLIN